MTQMFCTHAMATWWELRIDGESVEYAAQAAHAVFQIPPRLESLLSRFDPNSEISALLSLQAGERARLSPDVFDCLSIAHTAEETTGHAFSIGALNIFLGDPLPEWELHRATLEFVAKKGPFRLDLGAIGKGFALDQMAAELSAWSIDTYLLISGGSSLLACEAPAQSEGWPCQLSESGQEIGLRRCGLGASGFSVKGRHIVDPRTGLLADRYARTWATASQAAWADALSTAAMCLNVLELEEICDRHPEVGIAILPANGQPVRSFGNFPQFFGATSNSLPL